MHCIVWDIFIILLGCPEKDYEKAFEVLKKASDLGNSNAMFYLSELYILGLGTEKNEQKGIEIIQKAADLNNMYAQNRVALYYMQGNYFEKNAQKSF